MVKRHHGTLFRLGESVVIVGLSTFLLLHPVSCYYGFKYYDGMTEKIVACKTIDDLKSSVQQDWLDEVRFEKAGKNPDLLFPYEYRESKYSNYFFWSW